MDIKEDIKEDIKKIEQKATSIENSVTLNILHDYKRANQRLFIILLLVVIGWATSVLAGIYYFTNYTVQTTVEEATADSGNACIGDSCNNGEINGKS